MLRIDGQLQFSEYQNSYDVVVPQGHIFYWLGSHTFRRIFDICVYGM